MVSTVNPFLIRISSCHVSLFSPHLTPCNAGNPGLRPPLLSIWSCLSLTGQGEGYSTNVCTARFRLEVQALTLLYTIQPVNRLNVNPRGEGRERVTLSSRFFSPFPHTESPFTGYKPFFYEKGTPSAYLLLTNGASFTYLLLALWTILQTRMTDFPTLSYTSTLPFHIPEAWKRCPFRAEPPRIGHYREYPPGVLDSLGHAL